MESSASMPLGSFKPKKILHSSSMTKPSPSDGQSKATDHNPWSSKTPEKPTSLPRHTRSRSAIWSIKQIREAAEKRRKSDPNSSNRPDSHMGSAKQSIASSPSKTSYAKSKKADGSTKLPEKYEILDKFFNSLDSSIRLLRLKGSMSTFTNISPKIECLTDRRFSYGHLAQLKFILPEAIEVKKVLMHDERTNCMKPDLHVTLNVNAIDNDRKLKSNGGNSLLRKIFRSRLLDFFKAHPEVDEVPEETLPEPFNQSKKGMPTNIIKASNSSLLGESSTNALSEQQPATASHLSQSFVRRFSQQVSHNKVVDTNQESSVVSVQTSALTISEPFLNQSFSREEISKSTAPCPIKSSSKTTTGEKCLEVGASTENLPPSDPVATLFKTKDSAINKDSSSLTASIIGTPAKHTSTPAKLMSATPALQPPPKRQYMSPDDDLTRSPNKLSRRPPRSRSLKFDTPVKNANIEEQVGESGRLSIDNDVFDILPENLLRSIREKEKKTLEENDPAISQAKWRQKMIASLPKVFDMIHFLFQSIKRSVVTKEELMHRIIANHLDIVDRREVEEKLRLLLELVPEWICEKSASSGDILLCVNKISSPESIRARLAEAK